MCFSGFQVWAVWYSTDLWYTESRSSLCKRHSHVSSNGSLLSQLHWLPIHHRINCKLATVTFKALSSQQPPHLPDSSLQQPYLHLFADTLRSSSHHLHAIPRCRTEFGTYVPSAFQLLLSVTLCLLKSDPSFPTFLQTPSKITFLYPSLSRL